MSWINQTRGRYLTEMNLDVRATDLIRIAIDQLRRKSWPELKKLIDHSGPGQLSLDEDSSGS